MANELIWNPSQIDLSFFGIYFYINNIMHKLCIVDIYIQLQEYAYSWPPLDSKSLSYPCAEAKLNNHNKNIYIYHDIWSSWYILHMIHTSMTTPINHIIHNRMHIILNCPVANGAAWTQWGPWHHGFHLEAASLNECSLAIVVYFNTNFTGVNKNRRVCQHQFRQWLGAFMAPSHCLNLCL